MAINNGGITGIAGPSGVTGTNGGLFGASGLGLQGLLGQPTMDPNQIAQTGLGYNEQAAQQGINANNTVNLNNNGVFGSQQAMYDNNGNVIGSSSSLAPGLEGAAGTFMSGVGAAGANMPTNVNFDMTTPQAIAQSNIAAGLANLAPSQAAQQNQFDVTMAERGIPVQNTTDAAGNPTSIWGQGQSALSNSFNLANENIVANALNQIPSQQATMTGTDIAQAQAPGSLAQQNLGLIQGLNSLVPQGQAYNQGVTPINYEQGANDAAKLAAQNSANNTSSLSSMLQTAAPLAMGAMMM